MVADYKLVVIHTIDRLNYNIPTYNIKWMIMNQMTKKTEIYNIYFLNNYHKFVLIIILICYVNNNYSI